MRSSIDEKEFIRKKGSLDILFQLDKVPKSFSELEEVLRLSPNTLASRLKEARKPTLIKEELTRENGRAKIKYVLTEKSKKVVKKFESIRKEYEKIQKEIAGLEEQLKEKEELLRKLLVR